MNREVSTVSREAGASAPVSFENMRQLARSIAASKLYGVKTEDEALAIMMVSQAEGRHPALAVRDYHIIQGRPALKADTLLARFQAAGGKVDWKEYTDTRCVGVFSHPQAGSVSVDWTIERAQRIGLAGKDNWKNYPRAMLRARVISEGVRTCFPGIAVGIYTPEEIEDGAQEINITPPRTPGELEKATTEAVQAVVNSTALTLEELETHCDAMGECKTIEELKHAYMAAFEHAKQAHDNAAKKRFDSLYALLSADLEPKSNVEGLI